MPWNHLPPELREPIVKYLASSEAGRASAYATVCKEWQAWVEQEVFSVVLVDIQRLPNFDRYFSNNTLRQCSLKRLRIYPVQKSSEHLSSADFGPFMYSIRATKKLHLELGLPTFDPLEARMTYGYLKTNFRRLALTNPAWRPSQYGLPLAGLVTDFEFPRVGNVNLYRSTLHKILSSLPNLERIQIEPTTGFNNGIEQINGEYAPYLPLWPFRVQRVVFFEHRHVNDSAARPSTPRFRCIGRTIAWYSINLHELVVCNLIDAVDFFQSQNALPRPQTWANLRTLSLTSEVLARVPIQVYQVEGLLQAAAQAASRMPALQTMELWNFKLSEAAVFGYYVQGGVATIEWKNSFRLRLSQDIRRMWRWAAQCQDRRLSAVFESHIIQPQGHYTNAFAFAKSNLRTEGLFNHRETVRPAIADTNADNSDGAWASGSEVDAIQPMTD